MGHLSQSKIVLELGSFSVECMFRLFCVHLLAGKMGGIS